MKWYSKKLIRLTTLLILEDVTVTNFIIMYLILNQEMEKFQNGNNDRMRYDETFFVCFKV